MTRHFRRLAAFAAVAATLAVFACFNPCEQPADEEPPGVQTLHFGTYHVCLLDDEGKVWCTGVNEAGQLGDGTTKTRDELVLVRGIEDVVGLAVGMFDTNCAWNDAGKLWCWGSNEYGVLGDEELSMSAEPVEVDGVGSVVDVSLGAFHGCALTNAGDVYCWGSNANGQLGIGEVGGIVTEPTRVEKLEQVAEVRAGGAHSCARTTDGEVYCWGSNETGQIGAEYVDPADVEEPVNISQFFEGEAKALDVAFHHSCVIAGEARQLYCWGNNDYGQLGLDDLNPRIAPAEIAEMAYVDDLAVAGGQVCAQIEETTYCAGEVMRPVQEVKEAGGGFVFQQSEALGQAEELWSGVLAVCGPAADDTVGCRGVEHQEIGGDELF